MEKHSNYKFMEGGDILDTAHPERREFISKLLALAGTLAVPAAASLGSAFSASSQASPAADRVFNKKYYPKSSYSTDDPDLLVGECLEAAGMAIHGRWQKASVTGTVINHHFNGTLRIYGLGSASQDIAVVLIAKYTFDFAAPLDSSGRETLNPNSVALKYGQMAPISIGYNQSNVSPDSFQRELRMEVPTFYFKLLMPAAWIATMDQFLNFKMGDLVKGGDIHTPVGTLTRIVKGGYYIGVSQVTWVLKMYLIPSYGIDDFGQIIQPGPGQSPITWSVPDDVPLVNGEAVKFYTFKTVCGDFNGDWQQIYYTGQIAEVGLENTLDAGMSVLIGVLGGGYSTAYASGNAAGSIWSTVGDNNAEKQKDKWKRDVYMTAVMAIGAFAGGFVGWLLGRQVGLLRGRTMIEAMFTRFAAKLVPTGMAAFNLVESAKYGNFNWIYSQQAPTRL